MICVLSSGARRLLAVLSVLTAVVAGAACGTGAPPSPDNNPATKKPGTTGGIPPPPYMAPLAPFSADTPYTYVTKVKNILVGLPPTDAEIQQVVKDPSALGTLVQGWMKLVDPNNAEGLTYYQEKMLVFFKLAFQQTQISPVDFVDMFDQGQFEPFASPNGLALLQSVQESFARTMLDLTAADQPFTQATTTQTFALTTALKTFYALMDVYQTNDTVDGQVDSFQTANPTLEIYVTGKTSIPLSETLDKSSSNYMHWYVPGLTCTTDPVKFAARSNLLYDVLMGVFPGSTFPGCSGTPQPPLQPSYYSDWTMVTISQPTTGEATTPFYDLATLPAATTMVLNRPFVGFFTTPAFFANWQTNASNQMRVTTNQALIVALGAMISPAPSLATKVTKTPGLDATHATGVCVGCHQYLDPTRSLFAQQFSWNYGFGLQNATIDGDTFASQPGMFIFEGAVSSPKTIADFGSILSTHPLFAQAWVQKLSYYVNSQANEPSDPVFQKIVADFQKSYSWNSLVEELLTSPLTTNTVRTQTTTEEGVIAAVARRDHLCAALNFRLGFTDVCALNAATKVVGEPALRTISLIAGGLPSDGYGRGSTVPVLPNQPSLFYRAGTENICEAVAQLVIDVPASKQLPGVKQWSSTPPSAATAAITDFVTTIAGLTSSNPLYPRLLSKLNAHYANAMAEAGTKTTDALQSTFTAACLAPSFVGIGM
jgi:hypothetical protein